MAAIGRAIENLVRKLKAAKRGENPQESVVIIRKKQLPELEIEQTEQNQEMEEKPVITGRPVVNPRIPYEDLVKNEAPRRRRRKNA